MNSYGSNVESPGRSLLGELTTLDKGSWLFDLGHPLLNRIVESFLKAASIGAVRAVSRDVYFTTVEGGDSHSLTSSKSKKHGFPDLTGETNSRSMEALVRNTGRESMQWGLTAGMYSGLTYGLKEARGSHDWKNSAVAGAITGMAMALCNDSSHDQIVQCAITGAALSTAANLLTGVF